jgi:S-methylmethionine-dependent homocysteine/selenocysteine methylase
MLQNGRLYITDGGTETVLIHHHGLDLPCFASFPLLADEDGTQVVREYFEDFIEIAERNNAGLLMDTLTWRANPDWGEQLGYSAEALVAANKRAAALAREIRDTHPSVAILISGCVGPRGDGYEPGELMTAGEAEDYHSVQVAALADAGVDFITALTLTYVDEAVGIARAAQRSGLPVVISFTVETDGRLPSGQTLRSAIEETDARTDSAPSYYMVNCAHPAHFASVLAADAGPWRERIHGVRPNASKKSHAELDESPELDAGDPAEWAADCAALRPHLPNLEVVGGCCGTDRRHVGQVCAEFARGSEPAL